MDIAIKIPGEFTAKAYGIIPEFGKIKKEEWQQDGSWIALVELPGGLQEEFHRKLSELTGGQLETRVIK